MNYDEIRYRAVYTISGHAHLILVCVDPNVIITSHKAQIKPYYFSKIWLILQNTCTQHKA